MSIPVSGLSAGEINYHGAPMPGFYSDPVVEHQAVRNAAGLFDLPFRSVFSATGSDRARFLHNMVTNDVKSLTPGQGIYATILDTRGHILADLDIFCEENRFLLATSADLIEKVLTTLARYNIGGRVPLERRELAAITLQGPRSRGLLHGLLNTDLPGPGDLRHFAASFRGEPIHVIRTSLTGEEGFEMWAPPGQLDDLKRAILDEGRASGLIRCGATALETLRIEAGIPAYGAELAEDTLPLEANLLNALSFTKGCYIGQEIVERARSRGHVNWTLAGFFPDSPQPPAPGEKLAHEGKQVGEITSSCVSPTLQRATAMGYIRREVAAPGTELRAASGVSVRVTTLPFYRRSDATS